MKGEFNKKWLIAGSLGLLVPVMALVGCQAAPTSGETNIETINLDTQDTGISVSGDGQTMATPDLATLQLGIQSQQDTVEAARDEAAQAMSNVIAALKAQGIDDKDIQTQYFNISPMTRWDDIKNQQEVTGYQVTNTVSAKVHDIESVGQVIDAVAGAGGDLARVNGINFSVEDPSPYVEEIRTQAMADARAKAEQLAELAGVTLGPVVFVAESSYLPSPVYRSGITMDSAASSISPTPISAGQTEITLNVQVRYAIVN